ncbi:MAG: hypothetical protein ACJAT2_000384 [Bacteriovoracaceae bacterium]|jgi:hypothetical protein
MNYKSITIFSLFVLSSCGSANKGHPYRPSGKPVAQVEKETRVKKRKISSSFLRDRYKLCAHKRALNSAKYEYRRLSNREKRYGNDLTIEKNKYKKIIIEVGEQTKAAQLKFENTYNRRLFCTPEEMRHLNL